MVSAGTKVLLSSAREQARLLRQRERLCRDALARLTNPLSSYGQGISCLADLHAQAAAVYEAVLGPVERC